MNFQSCILTAGSMIVTTDDNRVYNVSSAHPNFDQLKSAYKDGSVEDFVEAYDIKTAVQSFVEDGEVKESGVTIVGDEIFFNGEPLHNMVVDAIQRMLAEGFNIKPMVNFLENMMKNPSYNSVKEMWNFIEAMGLTITEDGCFLAYKSVTNDYRDKYSGQIDNTPGANPPRMERCQVDDNPNNHCSHGYHVGALGYAGPNGWYHGYNDRVLVCKVNPADVVSVPTDHSSQKLRCCYYESVGEFKGELKASVYSGEVGDDYSAAPAPPSRAVEYIDADDLFEGEMYTAQYTKKDGTTMTRYFLVEDLIIDEHRDEIVAYNVELLHPETYYGEYRRFLVSGLADIKVWDGECLHDEVIDDDEDENEDEVNYW